MPVVERERQGAQGRARPACRAPRPLALPLLLAVGVCATFTRRTDAAVRFRVPETCGTHAEFSRELERLLGADAPRAEPESVTIEGGSNGAEYRLVIVLRDGTRELRHADCRTLFRSAVVVAAASYEEERRRKEPQPEAAGEPPVPPPPVSSAAPTPREEPPPKTILFLNGGVGLAAGPVPHVAPLFELSFGALREKLGLSLALRFLSGTEERKPDGHGVLVNAFGARTMVSYAPWRPLRLGAGVGAYRLNGEGLGASESLSDHAYAVEPAIEVSAVPIRTESFELGLTVGAHWAAVQPSFVIEGYGTVFEVPQFGGEGLFRAAWLIP